MELGNHEIARIIGSNGLWAMDQSNFSALTASLRRSLDEVKDGKVELSEERVRDLLDKALTAEESIRFMATLALVDEMPDTKELFQYLGREARDIQEGIRQYLKAAEERFAQLNPELYAKIERRPLVAPVGPLKMSFPNGFKAWYHPAVDFAFAAILDFLMDKKHWVPDIITGKIESPNLSLTWGNLDDGWLHLTFCGRLLAQEALHDFEFCDISERKIINSSPVGILAHRLDSLFNKTIHDLTKVHFSSLGINQRITLSLKTHLVER